MLKKLHNLKKKQLDQLFIQKNKLLIQLDNIEKQIQDINYELNHTSVDKYGAISDFVMLSIHRNYLKEELNKLFYRKNNLEQNIQELNQQIIELNKESEQYSYILKEQSKQKLKELNKKEMLIAQDFIQSKYIKERL